MTVTLKDYEGGPTAWCPGCGNFGILVAVKKALVSLQLEPHRVLMVSGIGQAGKLPHYLKCNIFNGLHGRTLPAALGAKLANHELTVIAVGGDGDGYGEGGNHNNQVYGLTKGQASPTSDIGFVTKTSPGGVRIPAFNPLAVAIALDATFVSRGFAGDIDHLAELIRMAIQHRGFALVDVLQPCVSFNRKNTYSWYKERIYRLDEEEGYDPEDKVAAFKKALEWGERIPVGVIYRKERPILEDQIPALERGPLIKQRLDPLQFKELLNEFA